ncbi:putative RNA-directed DNA polymerase from transposon X-element [Trichonephila clavipes]|nr:putative RNA-directed DNA polymerase from transposon X-element [Trichonephila clavipes]
MATFIADGLSNGQGAPLKEQNLSSLKQQTTFKYLHNAKNFVIHRTEEDTFSSVSPFLIQKGLSATVGSVKAVSKMRSGDLLVEVRTTKQAEQLLALQMLANIPITVLPRATLNSSRGVISESDLYNVPEQEILEGLQDQKVCAVRRITIRRDGQVVNTKHLILTFACPDLPQFITAGYLCCSVHPYIPNPLRCFQCQRFGHSKTTCRGKPTCARCGEVGHDSGECNSQEKCINCKGDHPSYSRSCNTWKLEKEIITVKIKNRLTYPEARLAVTNRTSIQGFSYAAVAKTITTSSDLNDLIDQLPAPFVILGDFNGYSTLWGSVKTNHRGRQIEQDLYNSDHFPVVLSHDYDASGKTFPPRYSYSCADWALFKQLAVMSDAMVKIESVDTTVQDVTNVLIAAADLSIPKVSSHSFQRYKPWWNTDCQTAYNQRKLWGIFRRESLGVQKGKGKCSQKEIVNILGETFQSVSSAASYNSRFLEINMQSERTPNNFSTRSFFPYNCDFTMTELQTALTQAHNTSPGPDGIIYTMLRHLDPNSLTNILFLFNRVWKEHCFPSSWREAIVIPILKPGKVATDPLSYRPIDLTSCFCKTFERMVNIRLVYVLEKEKYFSSEEWIPQGPIHSW